MMDCRRSKQRCRTLPFVPEQPRMVIDSHRPYIDNQLSSKGTFAGTVHCAIPELTGLESNFSSPTNMQCSQRSRLPASRLVTGKCLARLYGSTFVQGTRRRQ